MLYRIVISSQQQKDKLISLNRHQEHYLRRVVRLNNGDEFLAMDGQGKCWQVKLTSNGGDIIKLVPENRELPVAVTLMVALPKGQGFEEIIRCTTELGVNQLQPIISDRTLLKPSSNKLQRWRKIAQEAAEQSERQRVPSINEPLSVHEAFKMTNNRQIVRYIAFARNSSPHLQYFLTNDYAEGFPPEIIMATGCEGGWTDSEIQMAIESGFQLVSLGSRILRAVTAPIMAMSLISASIDRLCFTGYS